MKKLTFIGVLAALLPGLALAVYVGVGETVMVPPSIDGNQVQNTYLVGGTVNMSNSISGDLLAAGGTIIISGRVERDIMAAGGNVSVIGGSAEDVRVVGGNLAIGGKINGEIMAAGGQITITSDTVIARDSYIAGGSVIFAGTENGDLVLAGGQIRIDGTVNGDLTIERAEKVTFGPQAVIRGGVEYSAPAEATVMEGAQLASAPVFHQIQSSSKGVQPKSFRVFFGVMFFLKLLALLAAVYLLWYLRRKDMTAAIDNVRTKFWSALLHGFAVLVLVPVASIILLITVIGWIPAVVMLAAYGALLVLASPIAIIVATSLLMAALKQNRADLKWYHLLGGAIVLKIVILIPFLGWLACFIVYLISLGSAATILKGKF